MNLSKTITLLSAASTFLLCTSFSTPSGLPQGTEVWLFDFSVKYDNKTKFDTYSIGDGNNVSSHEGYDSQPSFSSDSKYMLWTSERDSGQTEIFRYDLKAKKAERMTNTGVSEYSPTYAPDGKNISCVVVEPDSTQRLWLYDKEKFTSAVMMPTVSKIGYHCWTSANSVFCFLLTEPFSLVQCEVTTGDTKTVAQNIGRCMNHYKTSKFDRLLYTVKDSLENATIMACDLDHHEIVKDFSIPCLKGSEDFARYNRTLFMASGAKIYYWDMSMYAPQWTEFADLSAKGLSHITRISISPDGKHIAVVDNK